MTYAIEELWDSVEKKGMDKGMEEGMEEGIHQIADLIRQGYSVDEAEKIAKSQARSRSTKQNPIDGVA